ncbi:hypothetical protein QE406_001424 [Microbacterium testaceum]|nr:hypothetical protein [Microbacterium testaceum]
MPGAVEHRDALAGELVAVAERAVRDAVAPAVGEPGDRRQIVGESGREDHGSGPHRRAGDRDHQVRVDPSDLGGRGILDPDRLVRGDLRASESAELGRVAPVVGEQVVGVRHRPVAVLAGVEQQGPPVHAPEGECRLQPGGAASDDDRVVHDELLRLRSRPSCDFMST